MSQWTEFVNARKSEHVREWADSHEFRNIVERDAACMTYSDGRIHAGEAGDAIAEDRRKLLLYLRVVMDSLTV